MDIKKANYDVLSNVVQRSYGQSSVVGGNPPTCYLNMKVLQSNDIVNAEELMSFLQMNITTIITHPNVESMRLSLRSEAMEVVTKTLPKIITEYKEEVAKMKVVPTNRLKPDPSIEMEILGGTLQDDFVFVSANMKSHCKTAYYRFTIKAKIV